MGVLFGYKTGVFLFQNNPKNQDLSNKTDLDYLGLFWKRKPHFIAKLQETKCGNIGRINSHLISNNHGMSEPEKWLKREISSKFGVL